MLDRRDDAKGGSVVLGVLVALSGLAHMARPDMAMADYAMGVFGVLMFISPWVMSFDALRGASWTAWVVGVLAAALVYGVVYSVLWVVLWPVRAWMKRNRPEEYAASQLK